MATYDFDIGIIGGGSAGLTVAAGAAQLGAKTLLIEKEKELGGDCLHFGCVPSKTLIKTAKVYHQMKNAKAYGLPEADVRLVEFPRITRRIRAVIEAILQHDSAERFCDLGAHVETGNPVFVDEHAVSLDGIPYSAKSWVIATGSSPVIPPIPGLDKDQCMTNRDIFYLDRLPKSMIIIGGGPIGIEMCQAFNRLGTSVTVVELGSAILPKEDKDMADLVMGVLEAEGVRFRLNATVLRAVRAGAQKHEVMIKVGDTIEALSAETILVAAGRRANLAGLGLEGIGVEFDGRGLKLDDRLRTTQKHIYGAGDVTGGYQFTHAAGYEGGIVVTNAVFHLPRKVDYAFLPWCTYTDPELASIGMNEKAAKDAGIPYSVWTENFHDNDRSLAEGETTGKIKMLLDEHEKPIGVQILGPRAGDLLAEWVAVINGKVGLSTLAAAVHPYPTLGEINKKVAGAFLSTKIFSEPVKKGLKLFFSLRGRACEVQK
ncbi:MAG TPA: FAD-dependent oxidoreductase [Syntrophales bacterium]|nr:FAD-dependent oxidoreductase [Syntrophales bacterium]